MHSSGRNFSGRHGEDGSLSCSSSTVAQPNVTMGHLRPRYNKARQEQLDARRQGRKKGHATEESAPDGLGSNADVLVPKTAAEKAKERELRKLQEEVRAGYGGLSCQSAFLTVQTTHQNESKGKMSSKKKKRLDNYVEKKLKAERRGELFKELEYVHRTAFMTEALT